MDLSASRAGRLLLRAQRMITRPPTWSGAHARYEDVPARGEGFEGPLWLVGTRRQTTSEDVGRCRQLVLLAALSGRSRILDFGGGMGVDYHCLRRSLAPVSYAIVERRSICEEGRRLNAGDPTISFHETAAEVGPIDILYCRTALQYLPDPLRTLGELLDRRPRYALLVDTSAGDIPTYVTAQRNVPGSVIPYWFLNVSELIAVAASRGYELLMKSPGARIRGRFDVPLDHRLKRTCDLLFRNDVDRRE